MALDLGIEFIILSIKEASIELLDNIPFPLAWE